MLEIKDVFSEQVKLIENAWKDIIKKHPEVKDLKSEIAMTISHPEVIVKSVYDERVTLCYRYFPDIFKGKLLVVVVKRLSQQEKYVATVYITDVRKGGEIIWPRR
ncbi:MAG: hypothetical protein WC628_10170 [Candidatus Omnitrophota bacterium]